jgi:TetR/AcrR family transcriptional repressor of nem operon
MARPRSFDRETVLEQIRTLFWERGYAATSYADIEAATGLKRTSLYNAFGDKDRLYAISLQDYRAQSRRTIREWLDRSPDAVSGIRDLMRHTVAIALSDPDRKGCFINNATNERAALCDDTRKFVGTNRHEFIRTLTEALRAEVDRGIPLPQPPHRLAAYLFTFYGGLMSLIRSGASAEEVWGSFGVGMSVLGGEPG